MAEKTANLNKEEAKIVWELIREVFSFKRRTLQHKLLTINTKLLSTGFEVDR